MMYDLGDCTIWEYMFPSNEKPILQIPVDVDHGAFEDEEEVGSPIKPDLPHSTDFWALFRCYMDLFKMEKS